MKKFLVLLFILLLSLSVVACVGKGGASAVKPIQSISSNEQSSSSVSSEQDNFSSSKQSVSESVSSSSSPSEQESVSESINFTSSSSSVSSTPTLSSDTSLNISKVFDKDLNDCSVQLSTQEYDDIVINKNSIVENTLYTLAEKAKVEAVLNQDSLNIVYTVTAEDGTTKDYIVSLLVKSNLAELIVNKICGVEVVNNKVALSEITYENLIVSNPLEYSTYVCSKGASVKAEVASDKKSISYIVTSEDLSTTKTYLVELEVANNYGSTSTGWGSKDNIVYDYDRNEFVLNGTASLYKDNVIVKEYWAIETQVSFNSVVTNAELVFLSYDEDDLQVRYVLRGAENGTFILFADYKDNSGFLNYTELKTGITFNQGSYYKVEIINYKNNFIIKFNDETVHRKELSKIVKAEMVLSSVNCSAYINDLKLTQGESFVKALMDNALANYTDTNYGASILGSISNSNLISQNTDGSIFIGGKDVNTRALAQLYYKGVPVGGYEYAVSGTLDMANTKTSGSAASKVELQIFKNFSNYKKMQFYRYDNGTTKNNSYFDVTRVNGGTEGNVREQYNTFATGTTYSLDYIIVYNNGQIQLYVKDGGINYSDFTKIEDEFYLDWGYTGFAFAMNQYADITLKNTKVYYGTEFDTLYHSLNEETCYTMSSSYTQKTASDVISQGVGNVYYATYRDNSNNTYIYRDNDVIGGLSYVLSGTFAISNYTDWSQAEVGMFLDDTHAVRFVFEHVNNGNYQVFTEYKNGQTTWQGWKALIEPSASVPATLNFSIAVRNGNYYFAINGISYQVYENLFANASYAYFNGKNCVTKITNLSTITSAEQVQIFVDNLTNCVYVSNHESTIQAIYEKNTNITKGGYLFAGSSSIDFWDGSDGDGKGDFNSDMAGYNAYNVGIGGTNSKDWTYAAYDRLIKPYEPSKFVLFLGGNDISGGATAEDAATRLGILLNKVHTDFPNCEIYYILVTPSPLAYNWDTKTFVEKYAALNTAMKNLASKNTWINIIDMEPAFTSLSKEVYGGVGSGIWADNQHLNAEGYRIWATIIKSTIFRNDTYTQIVADSWMVTKNIDGSSIFTSSVDKAWLNFNNILLHSKAVVEFDFKVIVAPTDFIQGIVFGMTNKTDNKGYCVGRAGNTKRIGGSVMENGGWAAWGSTATTQNWTMDSTGENAITYHYKVEFDISSTQSVVAVTVNDSTANYSRTFTFALQGSYAYRSGRYLGLFGGSTGGRVQISNLSIYGIKL